MEKLQGRILELFIISTVVLTLWEYIVGVFLEKMFHTKYWDYSDHKINFQGRICLTNSIFWGLLGVAFIDYIHPFICNIVSKFDVNIYSNIIYIVTIIMLIDATISIVTVKNIKSTWHKVELLNEEIKQKLSEIKENSKNKIHDKSKVTENVQAVVDELKIKRNRIIRKLYRHVYRLKKAFPAINTAEITEILNKKVTIKQKINAKEKRRK